MTAAASPERIEELAESLKPIVARLTSTVRDALTRFEAKLGQLQLHPSLPTATGEANASGHQVTRDMKGVAEALAILLAANIDIAAISGSRILNPDENFPARTRSILETFLLATNKDLGLIQERAGEVRAMEFQRAHAEGRCTEILNASRDPLCGLPAHLDFTKTTDLDAISTWKRRQARREVAKSRSRLRPGDERAAELRTLNVRRRFGSNLFGIRSADLPASFDAFRTCREMTRIRASAVLRFLIAESVTPPEIGKMFLSLM